MDFFRIVTQPTKTGEMEVFPEFLVGRSKDLMVRGKSFYAIWDQEAGLWSQDEYDVQRIIDKHLRDHAATLPGNPHVKSMQSFNSNTWKKFKEFVNNLSDNFHVLDEKLCFANDEVKKSDYVSRRLPYALAPGNYLAWDEMIGTLYSVDEREKIEWAIGAILSGDSKRLQKFLVLYGPAGTGKSTILNIIGDMFAGYVTTFEAKALGSNNGAFSTEVFRNNPLVAIQHDGDLSGIQDNTRLNSIISHEEMTMNEKYKPSYTSRINAFLLMGTNQPVKISDAKSGIIRRLIDVHPTGAKLPANRYNTLMSQIDFELGAIAHHCLEIYRALGKNHYNSYRPVEMMFQTDIFFNYIESVFDILKAQQGITLTHAYDLYKQFCDEGGIEKKLPKHIFRSELRNYFDTFEERARVNGEQVRSWYAGFNQEKFKAPAESPTIFRLVVDETKSLLDEILKDQPAQGFRIDEIGSKVPAQKWVNVTTTLEAINTSELHYVKLPTQHIVIDFDLVDNNGQKDLERNLEAASVWPPTYAELSQGGNGVHLHYLYDGDVSELKNLYSEGIEVKTLLGDSSLRRKLSKCNNIPIATLNVRLPTKEKKVLAENVIKSEKGLRELISRNLRKEIHPGTKPSIDFIGKILDEAYESGMPYDVTDLRSKIMAFANNSSNQALNALKVVNRMKFHSENRADVIAAAPAKDERLVFFDVEVFPNLFVICWKYEDADEIVAMINPTPQEVEALFKFKLVGFNNRRYDNHICYARYMGYTNQQLYMLSQKIIDGNIGAMFGEAYNLSYTDIYDYSSKKQGLKKFEIELGIHHMELDIPWDQPVPDDMIDKVVEYCKNDVKGTEATHKARHADFVARQILCDLSNLSPNHTTQQHTARIIFGEDKRPQASFNYTDLTKEFPGYLFERGKSYYKGVEVGEGGWVFAEPGVYENVAVLDVASMHPTSIIELNLFGDYTPHFKALIDARLAIKNRKFDDAKKMLNGKLAPYLMDESQAKDLSYALKIVINIVYGLTSAKFDNAFRDKRNVDNIVAKRGALFMVDLKNLVIAEGYEVVHVKTDSIKIPNADQHIIDVVSRYGQKFGYSFEHENTYDKFCLVNDAVYIAREGDKWTAVGAQFQHPYVYKKLFSGEKIEFADLCQTKSVAQGVMYLDFEAVEKPMALATGDMLHVGRTGSFVPVLEGGAVLYRVKDGKYYAVTGTKGHLWVEASMAREMGDSLQIDMSYFENLAEEAKNAIDYYGSYAEFVG